jgi:hypothetical protein
MSLNYLKAFSGLSELYAIYRQREREKPTEALKKGKNQISDALLMLGSFNERYQQLETKLQETERINLMMIIEKKKFERQIRGLEKELKTLKENIDAN